jgi:hypothetical protein
VDALNLKRSPENFVYWERADPFMGGAGDAGGAVKTSADCPPGVSDSIEMHNGGQVTRRATSKGSWAKLVSEYERQCKKRCSKGRVASDGDRYAARVSKEVG